MNPVPTTVGTRSLLRVPTRAPVSGRTALAALVVALVIGILGMHALASHGTPTAPAATGSASTAISMTGMTGMASDASHDAHDGAAAATGQDSGHDMSTMAMLCVAMLAAAFTLLLLLVGGIPWSLLPAAFAPAAVRVRVLQWVRGTGPPSVWQFSVIRC